MRFPSGEKLGEPARPMRAIRATVTAKLSTFLFKSWAGAAALAPKIDRISQGSAIHGRFLSFISW